MRIVFAWRAARGPGAILLACLALVLAVPAHAEQRIALVIANSAYTAPSLGRLPGTHDDAVRMAAALEADGFRVRSVADLDKQALRRAIADFVGDLNRAGKEGVGFLYYSGHGIADAPRGQNYLIPVDADIRSEAELPLYAEAMDDVLDAVEAAGAKAAFVVFDACRSTSTSLSRGSKGLQPARARTDTLIAFATAPGQTASDDGLYARVLAEELQSQGADSETLFQRVQRKVAESTGRRQVPQFISSLVDKVQFTPGNKLVIPSIVPPTVSRTETGDPYARWNLTAQEFSSIDGKRLLQRAGASYRLAELTHAAEADDAVAQTLVGMDYQLGLDVPKNMTEAEKWYQKAAESGNSRAMNNLGVIISDRSRDETPKSGHIPLGKAAEDDEDALYWYHKATNLGSAIAMCNIGRMYYIGDGGDHDYVEALHWFRKGAELGQAGCMTFMGTMYKNGEGVLPDQAEALRWYRQAAEAGEPTGMRQLGVMYENGNSVAPPDYAVARLWYEKAAALGIEEAKEDLARLRAGGH